MNLPRAFYSELWLLVVILAVIRVAHGTKQHGRVFHSAISEIFQELIQDEPIGILSAGEKFLFGLPGFDVLGVELWHIKIKGFGIIGPEEENFDLFIKNDISLCRSYPATIVVKDITIVKASDR